MIPSWNDLRVAEQHRQDLLRAAEEERLATCARAACAPRPRRAARALAGLGRLMVAWGSRLAQLEAAPAE